MNYSIKYKNQNLMVGNDFLPTYIDWEISCPLNKLLIEYRKQYTVQNDVLIYNHSYFGILVDIFIDFGCSIKYFIEELSDHRLIGYIRERQSTYYRSLNIQNYNERVNEDIENIDQQLEEIITKNYIVLEEFKKFLFSFSQYVKKECYQEHSSFKYVYNLLIDDMVFFKNTKVKSLDKYAFTIGGCSIKHSESRGKNNDFIPSGYCSYGSHVFINADHADKNKHGRVWEKRMIKQTFYHEIGHALDYLYYDDIVLKGNTKRQHSSYNYEFLQCCKLAYRNFKYLSSKLSKKEMESLSYFCSPEIKKITKPAHHSETPFSRLGTQIYNDIHNLFNGLKKQPIAQTPKKFSPKVMIGDMHYDYSRVLEETWSESFALLFNWIHNSFSEYDKYILTAKKSSDRAFIKTNYHGLIYLLDNFDWSKLNISSNVVIRKKVQIKKLLNYVNDMPLILNGSTALKFKQTKYLKFIDMLKHR